MGRVSAFFAKRKRILSKKIVSHKIKVAKSLFMKNFIRWNYQLTKCYD